MPATNALSLPEASGWPSTVSGTPSDSACRK